MLSPSVPPLVALFLLTATFYLNFFSRIIYSPLLPSIEKDLTLSHGLAGTFFLFLSIGYFVSLASSGYVSAKIGHKKTIVASIFAISVSLLLIASIAELPFLLTAFFILGLSAGLYLPSGISTISALFPPKHWGRVYAVHELAPNLAFLTAPLFASLLLPAMQWQETIYIIAGASFLAAFLYIRWGEGGNLYGEPPNLANCSLILGNRNFLLLVLLFVMGMSGTIGLYTLLPLFLVTVHNFQLPDANLQVGLSRLATLFSALAAGWLADRIGHKYTICIVLLLTGIFTIGIGIFAGKMLLVCIFLQPVTAVSFFPAGFALLSRIGDQEKRNVVISLAIPLAFVLGGGVFPALIARMADAGLFQIGIIMIGLFISLGGVLIFQVSKPDPGPDLLQDT